MKRRGSGSTIQRSPPERTVLGARSCVYVARAFIQLGFYLILYRSTDFIDHKIKFVSSTGHLSRKIDPERARQVVHARRRVIEQTERRSFRWKKNL